MTKLRVVVAAVLIAGLGWVGLVGLRSDSADRPAPEVTVADGVCDAVRAATDGRDANVVFFDFAHEELHDLADRVADIDRALAAELLRAKNLVEGLLDGESPPQQLRLALEYLHSTTVKAVIAVGSPAPETCT